MATHTFSPEFSVSFIELGDSHSQSRIKGEVLPLVSAPSIQVWQRDNYTLLYIIQLSIIEPEDTHIILFLLSTILPKEGLSQLHSVILGDSPTLTYP